MTRKPAAFKIETSGAKREEPARSKARTGTPRKPRSIKSDAPALVVDTSNDPFDLPDVIEAPPSPSKPVKGKSWLGRMFFVSFGLLLSAGVGLWIDGLVRDLFARADWLGWAAIGVTGLVVVSLFALFLRELSAIWRLGSMTRIRLRGEKAYADNDAGVARDVIRDLSKLLADDPATAAARKQLHDLRNEVIDGRDLLGLAESELLRPLDTEARRLILNSSKRVSVVTAVSPRALVDVGFVLFEAGRLIRRISELYGGRTGTAGFIKLTRSVIGHLAVTGSIAIGESLVQQVLGHGLAARLSSRLGEGVVNGLMTARIGIAAMDVIRPLAFRKERRPGMGDFLSDLTRFSDTAANVASDGDQKS